ncbi:MAG TPA: hypothetical protein DCP91_01700 [Eggerthellaceae bacterium]|nr:hypothetical protein [Eggerthellaceae bacterium]
MEGPPKPDGRRTRRTKTVRGTRSEAEAMLARMKLEEGKFEGDSDLTLAQYWELFYEPSTASLAESTRHGYAHQWTKYVKPMFGDRRLRDIRAREVESALASIERPGAQRGAYKLLRQMMGEAYRDELIDDNPMARRIRLKRMDAYEPDVLLLADLPAWCAAVRGSKWEPVLLCMLFAGLRREEACALRWPDFAFGPAMLAVRVDKTLTEVGGRLVHGPTKTAESTRTVFLSGYPFTRLVDLAGVGPLVPDSNGNNMAPGKISREYKKLVEGSGAKYVPMRNLRNSYATIMQGLGTSDSLISRSLGHTNLNVDYNHYFAANAPAYMANAQALGTAVESALHRVTS